MARTSHTSKQALTVFLVFVLYFTAFNNAYANTTFGDWSITDRVMQGANRMYTGAKTSVINGVNVAKTGIATIKPTTDILSKAIKRTGAILVVDLAIKELVGAVDYLMDDANNRVIYYEKDVDENIGPIIYYINDSQLGLDKNTPFASVNSAVSHWLSAKNNKAPYYNLKLESVGSKDQNGTTVATLSYTQTSSETSFRQNVSLIVRSYVNTEYVEEEPKEKYLPYPMVAQEIIDQARANDVRAGAYVGEAIDTEVAENQAWANEVAEQFENTTAAETETAVKPKPSEQTDPAAPPVPPTYDLPLFCSWAPSVCEAAIAVIKLPKTLTTWWDKATSSMSEAYTYAKSKVQEMTDFFKDKPELDKDTELQIPDIQETPDTNISFGGYCPAPISTPVNFAGISTEIEIHFTWLCQVADFIKPIVIALASFSAALIVSGIRSEND